MKQLLTLILIFALYGCGSSGTKKTDETASNGDGTEVSQTEDTKTPKTKWIYNERINEMTDDKIFFAQIEANEELEFDFPYNGGTKVWITLRKNSADTDAWLSISKNKGQFISNIMGNKSVLVRFDDRPAEKYTYSDPSDYSSDVIFIKNATKFINNLKTSQKTIIQCEFFNEGVQTIRFDTKDLEWNN